MRLTVTSAVLFAPILIPPEAIKLRALACVLAIDVFFRTVDYSRQLRLGFIEDGRFPEHVKQLLPFPVLLARYEKHSSTEKARSPVELLWICVGFSVFLSLFLSLDLIADIEVVRSSFLIDHTIKFVVVAVAVESLSQALCGLERLAGYDTTPIVDRAYSSRTVGEFWYRYNTRVHAWLEHNVFRTAGGSRRPATALLTTFFVSAILHEIGFAIATSRVDGYQFLFFILQAPAVILSRRCNRAAAGNPFVSAAVRCSTILWMWATSMFFFHDVNRVFPSFYATTPWLP